jgi:hypothetical protein
LSDFDETDHLPKTIKYCEHTLCDACLLRLIEDGDGEASCPFCREVFTLNSLRRNDEKLGIVKFKSKIFYQLTPVHMSFKLIIEKL